MPRLRPRPRNFPRFYRGRGWNQLSGNYAPRMFSNPGARRWAHGAFGTQSSPYGAGGGSMRQIHGTPSGHAGNVYRHMLAQSRMGGVNLGLIPNTPGYTGSRTHRGFRQDQSAIKRYWRGPDGEITKHKKELRKHRRAMDRERTPRGQAQTPEFIAAKKRWNAARYKHQQSVTRHRSWRRGHAQGINAPGQGKGLSLNQFFKGRNRGWSQQMGQRFNPRARINVRQDPRSGVRYISNYGFRRHRGDQNARNFQWARRYGEASGPDALRRGEIRDGRVAGGSRAQRRHDWRWKRPKPKNQGKQIPKKGTSKSILSRVAGFGKKILGGTFGGYDPGWGARWQNHIPIRRNADFTQGGRRLGRIQTGDHWNTGANARSRLVGVQGQTYRTQMTPRQQLRRQGAHAPAARAFMQPINTSRALRRQHPILRGGHGDYHQYVRNNEALWNPFR